MAFLSLLLALSLVCAALAADPLGTYNVDPSTVTVSGFSSGASFSTQVHVALSSEIYGSATLAGNPYGCELDTGLSCREKTNNWTVLIDQALEYEAEGLIDPTENLAGDPTFIWIHSYGCSRVPSSITANLEFYEFFGANVISSCNEPNGHGYPTVDYGVPCAATMPPFINNCGYNMAYVVMEYLLGGLVEPEPGTPLPGQLLEYDQWEFVPEGDVNSFDEVGGWVYVPSACQSGDVQCRLHVFFHGCSMGREYLGDEVVRNIGLLEVAELNNIVTLFPQLRDRNGTRSCWDQDGADGDDFATKFGVQIETVQGMIHRVLG